MSFLRTKCRMIIKLRAHRRPDSNHSHLTLQKRRRYSCLILFISLMIVYGLIEQENATAHFNKPSSSLSTLSADEKFRRFIDEQDSILDRLLPQRTAERGEFKLQGMNQWNDPSDEHEQRVVNYHEERLGKLKSFDTTQLSQYMLTQYEVMRFESELAVAGAKFRSIANAFAANHFNSVPSGLESWMHHKHRVSNRAEAKAYIERLRGVPDLFGKITAKVESARKQGIVAPTTAVNRAIETYKDIAQTMREGTSTLDEDIKGNKNIKGKFSVWPRLQQEATKILADSVARAYTDLAKYLETQILPQSKPEIGLWQYPDGLDYYRYLLKEQTSLELTPEEVMEMGYGLVAAHEKEMRALKTKMGKESLGLRAFFDEYRTRDCLSSEQTKAAMERMAKEMQPHWSKLFERDFPPVRIEFDPFEGRAREELDFTKTPPQPVFFLGTNKDAAKICMYQKWDMLELLAHEGIPGHGLEQSFTTSIKGLPGFRKNFGINAYAEGWALYAEYLPKEIGFYQSDEEEFGRIASSLFRACRLVIDASVHTGKMNEKQATEYLKEHSPYPVGMIAGQVVRYVAMPAQACSYYIGANKFWNLRKTTEGKLGDRFDIRKFHTIVLRNGNLPLPILESNVNRAIDELMSKPATRSNSITKARFVLSDELRGKKFLSTADDFTNALSEFDLRARMKSLEKVNKTTFLEFAGSAARNWTPDESNKLMGIISKVQSKIEQLSVTLPEEILIIKTSGEEEGRAAYTRRNAIVLPAARLGKSEEYLEDLLMHEMWHIISRYNPKLKVSMYAAMGFTQCSVRLPQSLLSLRVTNPDAIDTSYCYRVTHQGKSVRVAPLLYAEKQYDADKEKNEFFDYITSSTKASKRNYPSAQVPSLLEMAGAKRIFDVWEVKGFDEETFGTKYLIHPEEISASHFVKIMKKDFEHPLTQKLAKVLHNKKQD